MYPVSISCGHTLCRDCLRKALKFKKECPICRVPCLLSPHERLPVNVILQTIIEKKYPQRFLKKKFEIKEEDEKSNLENKSIKEMPVMFLEYFVMPETEGHLNFFERRYLQMVTACLRGDRRFILMVNRVLMRGFVVEIKEATPTPQGSIHARVRGISKFLGTRLYIPEESRNLYLNEESSLWYGDGNKVLDYTESFPRFEENKEENKSDEEFKKSEEQKEELEAMIPVSEELFALFKERLERMNEGQRRMFTRKFGDFDLHKHANVKKRLALLSFYICGVMVASPKELESLVFEKNTKERLEWYEKVITTGV